MALPSPQQRARSCLNACLCTCLNTRLCTRGSTCLHTCLSTLPTHVLIPTTTASGCPSFAARLAPRCTIVLPCNIAPPCAIVLTRTILPPHTADAGQVEWCSPFADELRCSPFPMKGVRVIRVRSDGIDHAGAHAPFGLAANGLKSWFSALGSQLSALGSRSSVLGSLWGRHDVEAQK